VKIREGEVHIWLVSTDVAQPELHVLSQCLTDAEREKAGRFRFDADQRRSIVSRAVLRHVLGRCCGTEPEAITLVGRSHGKPALADGSVEFNVSHSGELVAIALAVGTPVGVDIERVRPISDAIAIARRFFSPDEAARVAGAGTDEEFFAIWTAKEAVVKALGKGLGAGLSTFTVPERMGAFTPISCDVASPSELHGWCVRAVESPAAYRSAVAVRGTAWRVIVRQFHLDERR